MKAVILAGGFGTRLSEETDLKPKPMVEVGNKPILWHIMKTYSAYGVNDFIICCGYKGYIIKEYFKNYSLHMSDVTISMIDNNIKVHQSKVEPWTITLVDTGESTMTGGRLKRVKDFIKDEESFCFTYGDGIANINISELIAFHNQHGKQATVTATRPAGRYGALKIGSNNSVDHFQEKPDSDGGWINGGYFVVEPAFFDLIAGDSSVLEHEPLEQAAKADELMAYRHDGFWECMDTKRDLIHLQSLWENHGAFW